MSVKHDIKASVADVFEWITDPDFLVQRGLDLGELEMSCEVTEDDDGIHVDSTRLTEVELPAFLARIFASEQEVKITELWTGDDEALHGDVVIRMTGQPVVIKAKREVVATGKNSCTWKVTHTAKVDLPLIGGKAGKFIEQTVDAKAKEELEYLSEAIANQ